MTSFSGLPNRRQSLTGFTEDGDEIWIIRSISQKLYKCQGCYGAIEVGADHVVVQYIARLGGTEHSHWHQRCAEDILYPSSSKLRPVTAKESSRANLERRGRKPAGRRRRPRRG
jgi:hypothetical protein